MFGEFPASKVKLFNDEGATPLGTSDSLQLITLISICTTAYTLHICVACFTLYIIYNSGYRKLHRRHTAFVAALMALGTINYVFYALVAREEVLIGAALYNISQPLPPSEQARITGFNATSNAAALTVTFLAEYFLLYRCFVVWGRSYKVMFIPILLFIIAIIFGSIDLICIASPVRINTIVAVADIYWILSLTMNMGLTTLIVSRILHIRYKRSSSKAHGLAYTSIVAMLIESSLIYSFVVGIGYPFLPGAVGNISLDRMFSPLLSQVECIASELIILRFALGFELCEEKPAAESLPTSKRPVSIATMDMSRSLVPLSMNGSRMHLPRPSSDRSSATQNTFPSSIAAILRSHEADSVRYIPKNHV